MLHEHRFHFRAVRQAEQSFRRLLIAGMLFYDCLNRVERKAGVAKRSPGLFRKRGYVIDIARKFFGRCMIDLPQPVRLEIEMLRESRDIRKAGAPYFFFEPDSLGPRGSQQVLQQAQRLRLRRRLHDRAHLVEFGAHLL